MAQFGRTLTLLTLFCSFSDTFGIGEFRDNLNHPATSTPPFSLLPPQSVVCKNYTELSESWRKIDYVYRDEFLAQCDTSGVYYGTPSKYSNLTVGWYRFTGAAGTKLPTGPAPVGGGPSYGTYYDPKHQICATGGVAYIKSGGHPTLQEGIVTRDVCFEFGWNTCKRTTTLRVAACSDTHGEYFVYELQPVPRCDNAYCAID